MAALDQAITDAFRAGGSATINDLALPRDSVTGLRMVVRFDARNPRAEQWLRQNSSQLITAILDDQREAIQRVFEDGMRAGQNLAQPLDFISGPDAQRYQVA